MTTLTRTRTVNAEPDRIELADDGAFARPLFSYYLRVMDRGIRRVAAANGGLLLFLSRTPQDRFNMTDVHHLLGGRKRD